jgi:diguanylate cyclase (GGDEF)-like protein
MSEISIKDIKLDSNTEEGNLVNFFEETKKNIQAQRIIYWTKNLSSLMGEGGDIDAVVKIVVEKELEADYDRLTGVFTQLGILRRSTEELQKIRSDKLKYSVLFLDMDNLKKINDDQGHEKGDELLIEMVRNTGSCIRTGDIMGRWTKGDEFVILLPDCDKDEGDRIKNHIDEKLLSKNISASIGISSADHDRDLLELVKEADKDMYEKKTLKKNEPVIARST